MACPKPGETVVYARKFLKSIGVGPTDWMWHARGVLAPVQDTGGLPRDRFVRVKWVKGAPPDAPTLINCGNVGKWGSAKTNLDGAASCGCSVRRAPRWRKR